MQIDIVSNMEILAAAKAKNEDQFFADILNAFSSPDGKPPLNPKSSKTITYL